MGKRCMLAFMETEADFSRGCAYLRTRPRISATYPTIAEEPEPLQSGSGSKWITRRATVFGASAWGRRKPTPAQCQSTARRPPTHRAVRRRRAPLSTAGRCAPRRNRLSYLPRSRHQLVNVVVVAILDAGADAPGPRRPEAVSDHALPERRNARH